MPAGGRIDYLRLFSAIALFILAIACINFMNLSTAKSSGRIKEVGIKKVVGASRKTLIFQYIGESVVLASLSLFVAIFLVELCLPQFNQITGKHLRLVFDISLVLSILAITLVTGLLAGSYPALYLSGFRPSVILKGKITPSAPEAWARKGLVVFQFAIAIVLIVSVWVVNEQIGLVHTKNIGYERDQVVYFDTPNMSNAFLSEIKNIPGVINAGGGNLTAGGSLGGSDGVDWEGKSPENKTFFTNLWATYHLIETLGMDMASGRAFSEDFGSPDQVIFNETAIAMMRLKDPIGKSVRIRGEERRIVGVVKDFHFESLYEKVKPLALLLAPVEVAPRVSVKIQAGTEKATLDHLQRVFQKHNYGLPFSFTFMDEDYQRLYASEQRVAALSKYFAVLAIFISCLGLYGLAAFTAEQRTKEIGIRKVLGASVASIMGLLSKDFVKLVLVAIVIATPLSWYGMSKWLQDFSYRIDLEWWVFLITGGLALLIALLTVSFQAVKAALTNPVKSLRSE
jgi:hypothetical protein